MKVYGLVQEISKTNKGIFAKLLSKDAATKGETFIISLGGNEEGVVVNDSLRVEGAESKIKTKTGISTLIRPSDPIKVYKQKVTNKESSGGGYSGGYNSADNQFRLSVGNASNIAFKLYQKSPEEDIERFYELATQVYTMTTKMRERLLKELPERNKNDIGAKVGAAFLHATEIDGASLETLEKFAYDWVCCQIELETRLKDVKVD